jgi:hypothetical protein
MFASNAVFQVVSNSKLNYEFFYLHIESCRCQVLQMVSYLFSQTLVPKWHFPNTNVSKEEPCQDSSLRRHYCILYTLLYQDTTTPGQYYRRTMQHKDTAAPRHCCNSTQLHQNTFASRHFCSMTLLSHNTDVSGQLYLRHSCMKTLLYQYTAVYQCFAASGRRCIKTLVWGHCYIRILL